MDTDLDMFVAAHRNNPNRLYRNDGGTLTLRWTSPETDYSMHVAWGDWDLDGDLDLAAAGW